MNYQNKVTVIGEIGINWFGDEELAKEMCYRVKEAGADIAKFQLYRPEELLGTDSPYIYDAARGVPTLEQCVRLKEYCDNIGVEFGLSVFHADLIDFTEELGLKRYKIGSRSIKDLDLLERISRTGKEVFISTGNATEKDLHNVLHIFGPGQDITFLYCVVSYPTSINSIDFQYLDVLRSIFKEHGREEKYGFSSHCPRISPTLAAVVNGCSVIEHHIVKYKTMKGCDVSSSLNFDEFKRLVKYIRELEIVLYGKTKAYTMV